MATFEVLVRPVKDVYDHPNADRLSIVTVDGYNCISAKQPDGAHTYRPGDLVVYIPEDSVLTETLLKEMNFWKDDKGTLAGKQGNRVKAIKLRGVLSQGVLYPANENATVGQNVAEELGITKYEPEIPASMGGQLFNLGTHLFPKFDVENFQKYPDVLQTGEEVVATEKLHGTCAGFIRYEGNWYAFSKGYGAKGQVFENIEENASNVYIRAMNGLNIEDRLYDYSIRSANFKVREQVVDGELPITLYGEVYGPGIQDLHYGEKASQFRLFDVWIGDAHTGRYMNWEELQDFSRASGIAMVPVLYRGPFDPERIPEFRDGKDTISGVNVREGCVWKPVRERIDPSIGRVLLKTVSPDYLTRKGGTEYQ